MMLSYAGENGISGDGEDNKIKPPVIWWEWCRKPNSKSKEAVQMDNKSLSHTRWKCQYHIGATCVVAWSAHMRYHLHSWYSYHEMPSKWWKVWSSGTMRVSRSHICPTARNRCTWLTYVNHCKGRDTWNGESDWYTITKTVRGHGLGGFDMRWVEWTKHLRSKDGA